jgi:hypothetical protein
MNTVTVQSAPDAIGDRHIVLSGLYQNVNTRHNGRFGQLPDVKLVYRGNTVDFVY